MAISRRSHIKLQLVGIRENKQYELWKNHTLSAIESSTIPIQLEEINNIDRIMNLDLSVIPTLVMNNVVILEQNGHIPNIEEIKSAIQLSLSTQTIKMKNITVPTDFSDNAANALEYAKALSSHTNSQLKLVHICHPSVDSNFGQSIQDTEELVKTKEAELDLFVNQNTGNNLAKAVETSMYEQEVHLGYAANELVRISKEENTDLLLMGTTGKGTILEKIFGSVSTYVSQHATCPVWLVPPKAKFQGINNILYASNYESADEYSLQKIKQLSEQFDANVHLVHVNESNKKGDANFEELILDQLFQKKAPELDFKLSTIQSDQVWEGIDQYAKEQNIDLVVMLTQQRSFWDRIRHTSQTSSMILHAKVPLLIFHMEDAKA